MTMMTPPDREVTGGVDTHGDVHVVAVLDSARGRLLGTASFATTPDGYSARLAWLESHGRVSRVGCESTGSYGAGLCRFLTGEGIEVIEVDRPDRKTRRFDGKSDPIDAEAAARAVLAGTATGIPKSRDGLVEAIRVLEVTHHSAVKSRTQAINQFHALVVSAPTGVRARLRGQSFRNQLGRARRFSDAHDDAVEAMTRLALRELARRISDLDAQIVRLEARLLPLAAQASPALMGLKGVGPHVAAQLLAATGDNPDRLASEAAFAKLCGVCPLPASSGKTAGRHRLNRGGDRRANRALHTIVLVRMRHDATTRAYVTRRIAEGKTKKEIMRCLKRFVAREVFHAIVHPPVDLPTGAELRHLRTEHGLTLTVVANQVGTFPTHLSEIERGLCHDTHLARQVHAWLTSRRAAPAQRVDSEAVA